MDIGKDADECRERAAQCERRATVTADPTVRSMYAQLARQWRAVAKHTENLEQAPE
jgi:hypothetical protein